MKLQKAVGMRISELLALHNITEYKLSLQSGLSKQAISQIMNERYESIKFETMVKIADGFGITVQEFIDSKFFARENLDIKYD